MKKGFLLWLVLVLALPGFLSAHEDHGHEEDDHISGRIFVLNPGLGVVHYLDLPDLYLAGEFRLGLAEFGLTTTDGRFLVLPEIESGRLQVWTTGLITESHGNEIHVHGIQPRLYRSPLLSGTPSTGLSLTTGLALSYPQEGMVSVIQPEPGIQLSFPAGGPQGLLVQAGDLLYASDGELGLVDIVNIKTGELKGTAKIGPGVLSAARNDHEVFFLTPTDLWGLGPDGEIRSRYPMPRPLLSDKGWLFAAGEMLLGVVDQTYLRVNQTTGEVQLTDLSVQAGVVVLHQDWLLVAGLEDPTLLKLPLGGGSVESVDLSAHSNDPIRGMAVFGEWVFLTTGERLLVMDDHGHMLASFDLGGTPGEILVSHVEIHGHGCEGDDHHHHHHDFDHDHAHEHSEDCDHHHDSHESDHGHHHYHDGDHDHHHAHEHGEDCDHHHHSWLNWRLLAVGGGSVLLTAAILFFF